MLNEGIQAAGKLPRKNPEMEEVKTWNEAIAYGAIKYFDLCHPRDYIVDFEQMLSLKGNTAVYLLYALCRILSLQRCSSKKWTNFKEIPSFKEREELRLAVTIMEFPDIIAEVEKTLAPKALCQYLYQLACQFHFFYEKCQVNGSAEESSRQQLCVAVEKTLRKGLDLLGIHPVEFM